MTRTADSVGTKAEGRSAQNPVDRQVGEAVAWLYRYPDDPTWQLTQDQKQAVDKTGEVQPLIPASLDQWASNADRRAEKAEAEIHPDLFGGRA